MRKRLLYNRKLTLEQCADMLSRSNLDPERHFYNIIITGKIAAFPFQEIVKLPYEISIYSHMGKTRLMTGTRYEATQEDDISSRMNSSEFYLHTHPPEKNAKFDAPSFKDISCTMPWKRRRAIAYLDGILMFGKPRFDLLGNILSYHDSMNDEYADDLAEQYLRKKGVSRFLHLPGLMHIENISAMRKSIYQRGF